MEENKPKKIMGKGSVRALKQFKEMSEEEFDEAYSQMVFGASVDAALQEKYDRLMKQFEEEYDLTELLPNDRMILGNLVTAMLQLKDYEARLRVISKENININNITLVKELNLVCKNLRGDISEMQDDLGITRKIRKNDKEASVLSTIEDLKKRAAQFYKQKMQYYICENCGTLLATTWWLNPEDSKNKIVVHCTRILEDGRTCNWTKAISAKDIVDIGSNKKESLPESIR